MHLQTASRWTPRPRSAMLGEPLVVRWTSGFGPFGVGGTGCDWLKKRKSSESGSLAAISFQLTTPGALCCSVFSSTLALLFPSQLGSPTAHTGVGLGTVSFASSCSTISHHPQSPSPTTTLFPSSGSGATCLASLFCFRVQCTACFSHINSHKNLYHITIYD